MPDRAPGPKTPLLVVVAAALVDRGGLVLMQQRPAHKQHGGLWEFPGGKIEAGETPEEALARELGEELSIGIDPADARPAAFASGAAGLLLLLYVVRRWSGAPRPLEAAALAWRPPTAMADLAMPPADRDLVAALDRLL